MATVYEINKGVGRSIEFKGIKAQYISYLAVGLVALLLLFAILYISKVKLFYCLAIVLSLGVALVVTIQHLSRTYGAHGLQKKIASGSLPTAIRSKSRTIFISLQADSHAQK